MSKKNNISHSSHTSNAQIDLQEQSEWLMAFEDLITHQGMEYAEQMLLTLQSHAGSLGVRSAYSNALGSIRYANSIAVEAELAYPGNETLEETLEAYHRWNATVLVVKANKKDGSLGGHIGSGASILTLYEVGFNHCFKAPTEDCPGDLILYQGHTTPVIYARSYLEGRLTEKHLSAFRQQAFDADYGLSSYPHPWLQSDYWQFPTVSMGLGPLQAIYQARFMKYLQARGLAETTHRKVWAFCGDGEMDEPESMGALLKASRENLDNLIFVINCNLQRLDGLVNGNGKVVEEFAAAFSGAGWQVIKVLWDRHWQALFDQDSKGLLLKRLAEVNDGELQYACANGTSALRELLVQDDIEIANLLLDITDEQLESFQRGGHDRVKIYTAYQKAMELRGKPTVILAQTVKGFGLGEWGESKNIAHNVKKLNQEALHYLKDRFKVPVTEKQIEAMDFIALDEKSKEAQYLHARRQALGGYLPQRKASSEILDIPHYNVFAKQQLLSSEERELSTTTAFVRMLVGLIRHKPLSKHIVPITVDESRTFGMEGLFRQLGIYNHKGQQYVPEDKAQVMYYKESRDGQILQDGINEAGGFASWMAAATSYSVHNVPMIPFYIYYSMFGFQRIGDLAWAAGDSCARGFVLGGTAGRTTLNGEGLQHQDGHSHIQAGLIPNCVSYDPTYAYELAVILWDGMRRMYVNHENVFYYITLMNENYRQPAMPKNVETGIIKGLYRLRGLKASQKAEVRLMGSGTILREVEAAADLLNEDFNIQADVWSMTSSNELYRDAMIVARYNRLHPTAKKPKVAYITSCFEGSDAPVIAATDYVKLYTEQLGDYIPAHYVTLGTDGFGRSDTRSSLRHHFEVDRYHIVIAALKSLSDMGTIKTAVVADAIKKYNVNAASEHPLKQ